jgi:hypothetical protein
MNGIIPLANTLVACVFHLQLLKSLFEFLHSSSELCSTLPGSLHVELTSLWVVIHHLQ